MEPRPTDTRLIRTTIYNRQFRLSRRKKCSYISSKINPLNTDTIACPVGVRINGVPLVLKAERLVSYKIYLACTIRMQTSAFRDKRAVVIWSALFGHEAEKYVF